MVSSRERPASASGGRPMTTSFAPACFAPAAFSSKPPGVPPSFVTRKAAVMLWSMVAFIAAENGPCIAKMCAGGSPAFWQASRDDARGSTRAQTRFEKSSMAAYWDNSLLPVVSRILPLVRRKKEIASSVVSKYKASEETAEGLRRSRTYCVPISRQARAMLLVMDCA